MTTSPVFRPLDGALPQNIEAEQSVLGAILIDPSATRQAMRLIRPEDFYLPGNETIYRAMLSLAAQNTPPDVAILADYLHTRDQLDGVGGAAYLASLASVTPTSLHLEHYARIVERSAVGRRLIEAGNQIGAIGYDESNEPETALEKAERVLSGVREARVISDYESTADYVRSLSDELAGPLDPMKSRLSFGIGALDSMTGGIPRGELVVVGAPASTGKTSLGVTACRYVSVIRRQPAVFVAVEMTRRAIALKHLAIETRIPYERLESHNLTDDQRGALGRASSVFATAPCEWIPAAGWTANRVVAELYDLSARFDTGLALVVIDYLQVLAQPADRTRDNQNIAITRDVNTIKEYAVRTDTPVMLLSSLNRNYMHRASKEPVKEDLRDSGNIEFAADKVLLMWPSEEGRENAVIPIHAKVDKNRLGPTGRFSLGIVAERQEIVAMVDGRPDFGAAF